LFQATGLELEKSLNIALETGYRFFDTAVGYNNESVIGKVLNEWISAGKVTREELFVLTKVLSFKIMPNTNIKNYNISVLLLRSSRAMEIGLKM